MSKANGTSRNRLDKESESEEELGLRSEDSQKSAAIGNAQLHQSKRSHREILDDMELRSTQQANSGCIALRDRISYAFYNLMCCRAQENSYVNELEMLERTHPIHVTEQAVDNLLRGNIVELIVLESSRLELDPNVIHPFVRVHFVDKDTGAYLKKKGAADSAVYHSELNGYFDRDKKKYQACHNDLILPFSTGCSDFRNAGNSRGSWRQRFYINDEADHLLTTNTIVLFELLDYNHKLLAARNTGDLDRDNFYRIAWGFIRPMGISRRHLGQSKLQLYRYKFDSKKLPAEYHRSFVPTVYYDFIWPNHEKYEGYLSVRLNAVKSPSYSFTELMQSPETLFEEERPDRDYLEKDGQVMATSKNIQNIKQDKMLRYYRIRDCLVPEKLIAKLETSSKGCLRLAMTDYLLFCCCTDRDLTVLQVYSLENMARVMTLKGHLKIIYDVSVSKDQKLLVTVGSDMMARLWQIPQLTGEYIDEEESEALIVSECIHPSYVYCGALVEGSLQNRQFMLTGCYDGLVRLWQIDTEKREIVDCEEIVLQSKATNEAKLDLHACYPTCITTAEGMFVVGDSLGSLHIYDVEIGIKQGKKYSRRCTLTDRELEDDPIRSVCILSKSEILVQSKDNVIRRLSIATGGIKPIKSYIGAQSENFPVRCTVSPDRKFVLSGSEEGYPVMWSLGGQQISLEHLQLRINGPIADVVWNRKYNIVACCGFVEECPVFVFGNVAKQQEQQAALAMLQQQQK